MLYPSKNMVTRAALRDYAVPTVEELRVQRKDDRAGSRWKPIPHLELIEEIESAAKRIGLRVESESFCTSDDGHDIYGFLRFDPASAPSMPDLPGSGGITPEVGFRHSNMQRMRLYGVHGERVAVCANGMIVGDFLFGFKTTSGNVERMEQGISEGMEVWSQQATDAKRLLEFLFGEEVTDERVDRLLMEGARRNAFAWGQLGKIDAVYRGYLDEENPYHEAFGPRNLWSLVNAVTEVAKTWSSPRLMERGVKGFPRVITDAYGFEVGKLVEDEREGTAALAFNESRN
jgi:hypothetical protein